MFTCIDLLWLNYLRSRRVSLSYTIFMISICNIISEIAVYLEFKWLTLSDISNHILIDLYNLYSKDL